MTVIRAFDLDDVVPAGRGAGDADRTHRGLGAGVREADLFEAETPAQLLREQNTFLGGRREVGATRDRDSDRLDDLRVRVADDHRTEPAVGVDVLGPAD